MKNYWSGHNKLIIIYERKRGESVIIKCIFNFHVIKIDFNLIDFIKLMLVKRELNINNLYLNIFM